MTNPDPVNINSMKNIMNARYENMKEKIGFNKEEDLRQEQATEEIFR